MKTRGFGLNSSFVISRPSVLVFRTQKLTEERAQRQARFLTGAAARADNLAADAAAFNLALKIGVASNDDVRTSPRPARPSPVRRAGARAARRVGAGRFRTLIQNLLPHLDAPARIAPLRGAVGRSRTRGR